MCAQLLLAAVLLKHLFINHRTFASACFDVKIALTPMKYASPTLARTYTHARTHARAHYPCLQTPLQKTVLEHAPEKSGFYKL